MTISYTITEEKEFEFEPKDIVALAVESRHKLGFSTEPGAVYDDAQDNLDVYLEELGLPCGANEGEGIQGWVAEKIMKEVDKYIDWDSEEL